MTARLQGLPQAPDVHVDGAVLDEDVTYGEAFRAFLVEARGSTTFRAFSSQTDARAWLCSV